MKLARKKPDEGTYWCRRCGAENYGHAKYSEMIYGSVSIGSFLEKGEVDYGDDWDTQDSDNLEIYQYECGHCGLSSSNVDEVFTRIMSTPLVARQVMLRMIEKKTASDWVEKQDLLNRLNPIGENEEKDQEVEYAES